jgi:GTP:adenosylcobinamide-phosphate guanylyltransferase/thiamine kinase-like enzyme
MAGKSSRFDYNFKPFLNLDNRVFIEHVMDSFDNLEVNTFNFIIRKEQENLNQVTNKLKNVLFPHLSKKINVIVIDDDTDGPFQTIRRGLKKISNIENLIICDCDHYVDIAPITEKLQNDFLDIVIPTWKIKPEEQKNWGKVIVNQGTNTVVGFCEKQIFQEKPPLIARGTIGCYYFRTPLSITEAKKDYVHFSEFFSENHKNFNIGLAQINKAYFFGDPKMAKKAIEERRKKETIICDVDGVLLKHKSCSNDLIADNFIIGSASQKIKQWRKSGKLVVLSTARPERTRGSFKTLLSDLDIEYDRLVMGLNPGPRYLINDLKPSNPLVRQSLSINLTRDEGIDSVCLSESDNYSLKNVKFFKGNSFSKTVLLKKNKSTFVRKYIVKNKSSFEHYKKLKRQMDDLERFRYYDKSLVPKILNFHDNDHYFYFDMEYLENYSQLDQYTEIVKFDVLQKIIHKLEKNVYCYRKKNNSNSFIDNFFDSKITPKLNLFEKECPVMDYLINEEHVFINNKKYFGLRKCLDMLNIYDFNTEYLNPIHGDLTLENILYNENFEDFKLIDLDGSRYVDSCYFDLGKIFQSIVSNYKEWNKISDVLLDDDIQNLNCIVGYFNCEQEKYEHICKQYANIMGVSDWKETYRKGIFYMSMYFIRFIPFRRQINHGHGIFAMIMAVNWLNHLLLKKD